MALSDKFSKRAAHIQPAKIRNVMAQIKPDFIPFAAGKPAPSLFPLEAFYQQTGKVLETYGDDALQYSGTIGFEPLRSWIANRIPMATAEDVCIISGSQQAIELMGRVFLDPGDQVVVSAPTYTATMTSLQTYAPEFVSVSYDNEGFDPIALEQALAQHPKLLYAIPNFMNPSGVSMSLARRHQLVELARKYDVPILEDDPYGELRFKGEPLPNLYELAPEQVVYAGTFSKIVAPGLRIGWIVAPPDTLPKLIAAKQGTDLQTGIYQQTLIYEIVKNIDFNQHIRRIRDYYQRQCEVMLECMQKYFPTSITYDPPAGGMFIWCTFPDGHNTEEILPKAMARKVAYIPGSAFYANNQGKNTLRLSFSLATEDEIREGIKILGEIFTEAIRNN